MPRLPSKAVRAAVRAKLDAEAQASAPDLFRDEDVLSPSQVVVVQDEAPTVVLEAGRRFGKSHVACKKSYNVARAIPGCTVVLIGATQGSISRIFWRTLKELNRKYRLGVSKDGFRKGSEGWTVNLPNGSQIILLPVDSVEAADKARGLSKVALVVVDESQRYKKDVLDYLLLDVIKAMFLDLRVVGENPQLWLLGTPNPSGAFGTFWDYRTKPGTSLRTFTTYDNTKLGTREQIEKVVDEMLAEVGQTRDGAWYQTEIMCRWGVVDLAQRAYCFDRAKNLYVGFPTHLTKFIVAADIGVNDEDAFVVLGWGDFDPRIYLVEEIVKAGLTTDDEKIIVQRLWDQYHPFAIVVDTGGQGLKTFVTIQSAFPGLPLQAAVKPAINVQVKLFNDALKSGFACREESRLVVDVVKPTWKNGLVNGTLEESGAKKSNIIPACRYGVIAAIPYLPTVESAAPQDEIAALRRRLEIARAQEAAAQSSYDPSEFDSSTEYDDCQ